jgi:polar amino acid transport system substrate-binding protein
MLAAGWTWSGCSKTMSVVPEDWAPYSYQDKPGHFTGLDIELMQAIFKEAGCKLEFKTDIPRLRRHAMHKDGRLDVLFAASETEERKQFSWFTKAYRDEVTGLFARGDDAARFAQLRGFADVLSAREAVLSPNAGWYGDDYAKNLPDLMAAGLVQNFEDFDQALRMLKAGRAGLLMGDVGAVTYSAREKVKTAVALLPFTPNRDPVHLMLSKKSTTQADVDALDGAIARLEKRGDLARIRARYGFR